MAKDTVDIKNFMGVLAATENTEEGIRFPGAHMPLGRPLVSPGVTVAQLMQDKSMAMQWHESIVGDYERQENERNHVDSTADAPDLVIGGQDEPAPEPARSGGPATVHPTSLEEELQARCQRWTESLQRVEGRLADLEAEYREAKDQLVKCEAALDAIRGV